MHIKRHIKRDREQEVRKEYVQVHVYTNDKKENSH